MIKIEEVKDYFGNTLKTFPKVETAINDKLSATTKKILYEIGLPNYHGYGGDYIMLDNLQLVDKQYLQFATRDFDEEYYKRCIDLNTGKVVFNLKFDYARKEGDETYHILNSDLETYLKYIYIYDKFRNEVKIHEKLGAYDDNHSKYAKELKKQLLNINSDVNFGSWADLIEEMDLGVI